MKNELSKFFKALGKEVQANLEEYWKEYQMLQGHIELIVQPIEDSHERYYQILEKHIKTEYRLGQEEAERLVNLTNAKYALKAGKTIKWAKIRKMTKDLFGTLEWAEEDLLERVFIASQSTMSRVSQKIRTLLSDGYKSGMGINHVARTIEEEFQGLQTWESKRIARTEIHNSHNRGVMNTYQDMGVEYTQWIAAHDSRTRDSHIDVDGEIIAMGETYSNDLKYPGDTSGPIEEWINCRCSNAPFVIPYGYMAPSHSPFREEDLIKI